MIEIKPFIEIHAHYENDDLYEELWIDMDAEGVKDAEAFEKRADLIVSEICGSDRFECETTKDGSRIQRGYFFNDCRFGQCGAWIHGHIC